MSIYTIALDNLKRRKGKTAFLVAGILIGIMASVSLLSITVAMRLDFREKISRFGANIIITPRKDELPLTYGSVNLPGLKLKEKSEIDQTQFERLKKINNIKLLSPKVIGSIDIDSKKGMLVGTNFTVEKKLKSWWKIKGKYPILDNDLLAGSSAAKDLQLSPGKNILIDGKTFIVKGVIEETGSTDDNALFSNLAIAQNLLKRNNHYTLIEASVTRESAINIITEKVNSSVPNVDATAVKKSMEANTQNISLFSWFSLASSIIILFVASLIVFITMMSSVNERIREIGIFRAIGFRKAHVFKIIMTEAIVIGVFGGLIGSALGFISASIALPFIAKDIRITTFNLPLLIIASIAAILICMLSSYLPARKASNLDPAEALRFI